MISRVEIDDTSALLSRARSGDESAFVELYRNVAPIARRVAYRIVRDIHVADDLVQEAFYLVLKAVRSGHGPTDSFGGYVVSTVKRLAYRQSAVQGRTVCIDDFTAWDDQATAPTNEHQADLVNAAWASLPPRWRHVLWLIDVDRYSPSELAPAMSMTANAVSSLATRARRALRAAYMAQQREELGAAS
ncbi:RNA polymerase sigma factor [Phytoactinopolyspora halotolerans]|uniref:Sigma-70 family RNA polymerase sigma factor n=1 Tax=Phytoactinopolyspora halotolerans TaxID=1981512 RepID=A0A6L9SFS4_9ACTN|nr:sigma-70 family RNA polymerase sigma factor [Phytoactinopolyspora halotolerans]NEE03291.1 sigma-70 family RNA polymerase sigma factor [Phytoactinopolyspora halotolerans]